MLRLYFLQQWYALSDPGLEDALYEIESMRRFAGLELADDALPDETTIEEFPATPGAARTDGEADEHPQRSA
jgi:IS5 family transposase